MIKKQITQIQNEIEQLNSFLDEKCINYENEVREYIDKRNELREARQKIFIENKMYCPIEELEKYEGEEIYDIDLVLDNGETEHYYWAEIMKVKNGKFYLSDEHKGIIEFNEKENKYYHHYYGSKEELNIVGFYNLILGNSFKKKPITETELKELIKC